MSAHARSDQNQFPRVLGTTFKQPRNPAFRIGQVAVIGAFDPVVVGFGDLGQGLDFTPPGAAHHRPQVFQVVVAKNRPPIACGKVRVNFIARKNVAAIPTIPFKTPRGPLKISSPEATAFDLVGYSDRAVGLDNVATILSELAEKLDGKKLVEVAQFSPIAWAQRLGYLLDLVGENDRATELAEYVAQLKPVPTPLDRSKPFKGMPKDARWAVMVNAEVEAEI